MLLAVEWESNAVETYKLNHPTTQVFHGDIASISVDKVLELTGIKVGELDIFDGSPPCQGFSTTGKRVMDDDRNDLFKEYCRLVKGLKPKVLVMENVSGMVKGNMKFVFVEALKTLKECGYRVKAKLMNAKYYGVPQSRQRMIFIGVRDDFNVEPSYPEPCKTVVTVRQAFKNCPEGERKLAKGQVIHYVDKMKEGEQMSKYHPKGSFFSTYRLAWDKPSKTITKTFRDSQAIVFHPEKNASLSLEEVRRLFTFPDDYKFVGKFEDGWARMGNSVPPDLMKAIALHIKNEILPLCQGVKNG
jgi:DNA (cytosine-5)-methyltransferase 1